MFNWRRHRRFRKDKEGRTEVQKGGRLEDSTTTTKAGTPALDAGSSIPGRSRLKTNSTSIEIQAVEATKTEEEHSSSSPAAAALAPACAHAETKCSPTRRPEDIWDQAYDSLQEDDAELVDAYERILSSRASAVDSASETADPQNTIYRNPEARREQMHKLIQDGLQKTNREAKIIQGIGEAAKVVLSANDMINTAIQAVPQAALAWTGVCFALQILVEPMNATAANRKGIEYVVTRMNWYWDLSSHLLKENTADAGAPAGLREQLEQRVIDLCKALLTYQINSICSYFRNRPLQFLRNLARWDDWDGDLQAVLNAEDAVQKDSNMYNSQQIRSHLERLVHLEDREMELLRDVRQALQQQHLTQLEEKDQQCLQDLRLSDPRRDKERISSTKGGLLKDSYKWILSHEGFQQWENNKQIPLLWIKGGAGKGKTMLLIGIINELEKSTSRYDSTFPSFFLCQSTNGELNSVTAVLRGLIYMLLIQHSCLISHVREEYKRAGKRLFEDGNAFYSLSRIFEQMLHDPRLTKAYLIVDALDECDHGLEQLLSLITKTASLSTRVKWILSSRERPDIEQQLTTDKAGLKLSLEVNVELVSQSISTYIDYKVSQLTQLRDNKPLQDQVRHQLREKADGTFLWVALVFDEIRMVRQGLVLRVLQEVPSGLFQLYDRMMNLIEREKWDVEICYGILAVTTLAYRPLHLLELRTLTGAVSPTTDELSRLVHMCGSFLTIQENYVYLIHQSAKDYLTNNAATKLYPTNPGLIHFDMFTRSLAAISETLQKRDIYELRRPGILVDEIKPPNPDPLVAVRYSCVYWVDHLRSTPDQVPDYKNNLSDRGAIFGFFKKHFLYWLEALSLSHSLLDAISSIRRLQASVKLAFGTGSQLRTFLGDAERFVLSYRSIIERAPLQIYACALAFCPTETEIKKLYRQEQLPFIKSVIGIRDTWDSCLQTLEGHSGGVNSVAFSPDSTLLASASRDSTVKIWDASSGTCLQTLEDHSDEVKSVAFSPDSTRLVSASWREIKIWDTSSGTCLQMLKDYSDGAYSVAFSPDSTQLASASGDSTVKIWDASSGTCLQKLVGHSSGVYSVAFSPDSKLLASASGEVKIWDASSGACLQTLEGHIYAVWSLAFSPDSTRLASASWKEVKIWDASSGACLQIHEDYSGWVYSVAFSPDSTLLASASDRAAKIWDTSSGACLQTFEDHSDEVKSVAFSPDSTLLASASGDNTVKIWDTSSGACLQTHEGHSRWVNSVAFSPDSTRLASASDSEVKIWDASSGTCLQTLEDHSDRVKSVAFSPDSTRLASALDSTVKIWDTSSGTCLQKLVGHSGGVNSVAFSPDSTRLASASHDSTVKIWDASRGTCLQTLEDHSDEVNSVAFSPDSTQLASVSDSKVKIWDTSSGTYLQTFEAHSFGASSVAFSPDSKLLASVSGDGTVKIWDTSSGACLQTLEGLCGWANSVAFSRDLGWLASASASDSKVKIWDTSSGTCLQTLEGLCDWANSVAFSPDSTRLASASWKEVKIWDTSNGACLQTLNDHSGGASVAFSPDSTRLASVSWREIEIWDASRGACLQKLEGHSGGVRLVAFSPDSTRLASASGDGTIKIWDASNGAYLQTLSFGMVPSKISFDATRSYLHSALGILSSSSMTPSGKDPQSPRHQGCGLSLDREWITYNSENWVWLPSEYRPSCSAVLGKTIGIGVGSGKVWICDFTVDIVDNL